jgi:hypothetical protein
VLVVGAVLDFNVVNVRAEYGDWKMIRRQIMETTEHERAGMQT